MKRDLTTYLAIGILVLAALFLAAPQIYRLQNAVAYNVPADPNGQVSYVAMPTILPSGILSNTNTISSTITISPTVIIVPTEPFSPTESFSPTIAISPTVIIVPTESFSPTATILPSPTTLPTNTVAPTETISPSATIIPSVIISPTATTSPTEVPTSNLSLSGTNQVAIKNYSYNPSPLVVPLGTTVKWTQFDKTAPHTVSAGSPTHPDPSSRLNSKTLTVQNTSTYEFTFDQPGVYPYYCVYHLEMQSSVIVADAQGNIPTPAPVTPEPTKTPFAAAPPANAQLVVSALVNPRGFTLGPDGAIYVAEAGTVPDTISSTVTISPTTPITVTGNISPTASVGPTSALSPPGRPTVNPICESQLPSYDKLAAGCPGATGPQISNKGRISRIAPDGTRTTVAENLPTTVGPFNDVFGVNSVAFVGNDLYVIIAAGASRGHPDFDTGVYRVANGTTTLIADLETFQKQNPPKFIPEDYNYTLPYDMLSLNGKLYITDGNAAVVFQVDPAAPLGSNIQRIIDLSPTHNVLTGIAAGADNAIYFTEFTPAPYPVGGAQIFKWSESAGLTTVTAGLSIATGIALAPDGTMYASEFATDLGVTPFITPPGRIVKITTDGKPTPIAAPLVYPTSLRWLNNTLYVTNNGVNAIDGQPALGAIYRITLP